MAAYNRSLPTRSDVPSASENKSQAIGTTSVNVTFSQDVISFEIMNNSPTAIIYININGGTADPVTDMPVYPRGFYAADRLITLAAGISIISSEAAADVRIVGHHSLVPEA